MQKELIKSIVKMQKELIHSKNAKGFDGNNQVSTPPQKKRKKKQATNQRNNV
jgi:hypothetical protein